jgi:Domain of unknown function (DUF4838)/Glycosyl hydrolase family 20, domain 2
MKCAAMAMIVVLGVQVAGAAGEWVFPSSSKWTLVVAEDAIPSERYAAEEFQSLFERATGVKLPLQAAPPAATGNIFIGSGQAMAESTVGFTVDDLGDEGLRIRVATDNIAIAGDRPRGTLYGVYEFLERHIGVRFLTAEHTHVPEAATPLRIPCGEHTYAPKFSFRWSYYNENAARPDFAARLRVNTVTHDEKLGGVTPQKLINHSFHRYVSPAKYGKDHPEYFALVNGERRLDMGGGGPEPCVSNPDVIRIMTEGVLADIRANPSQKNISLSQNDNDAYCRCDQCEAINQREGTPMGSNLHLVNIVADAVAKEFPDVKVGTLSYWYTRKPPKHMKPRDNVQIQLCSIECCTTRPLDDPKPESNREFCADMEAWGKICDDIWVWHYNTNFAAYLLPFPNLRAIGPNVRFFARNNVKGVFMQANGNGKSGELSDLRNYVMGRCLWDPSLDSWALAEEFCRLHYAEAAGPIIEYLTFIHDVAEASDGEPGCFGTADEFGFTGEVARKAFGYFEQALASTQDPSVRARVEKASISAYCAMIECSSAYQYVDGKAQLVFPEGYTGIINRYADLCQAYGVTRSTELQAIGLYLEKARRFAAGVPAARVENDTWRITALPEIAGKLIEVHHKPTGRDLLATWSRAGIRECGGTFGEESERGSDWASGVFEASVDGSTLTLSKETGAVSVERRITLADGKIRFDTTITHKGKEPAEYLAKIHPEWDAATTSKESAVVAAYILDNGAWKQFNQDWKIDHGPQEGLLQSATGGGFAFYNHEAGFGVVQTYEPDDFDTPRLWHHTGRHQVNLELFSNRATLKSGEQLTYAYECALLEGPPK